jgi:hypothetical protein
VELVDVEGALLHAVFEVDRRLRIARFVSKRMDEYEITPEAKSKSNAADKSVRPTSPKG